MSLFVGEDLDAAKLERMGREVLDFRVKFEELMTHYTTFGPGPAGAWQVPRGWPGPVGAWQVPREGHDEQIAALTPEVAKLAGRGQMGIHHSNNYIQTQDENGRPVPLNPVKAWLVVTQPKPMLAKEDIVAACLSAEGHLETMAEDARARESTWAYKVARVIGWPAQVRDMAGLAPDSRQGKATVWSIGAIMAGVLASLIAAGLIAIVALALQLL